MTEILMQMDVEAPADRVWTALTSPDGVRSWWTTRAEVDASEGGVSRMSFPDAPVTWDLRTDDAAEGQRLHWHCVGGPPPWIDTDVVFDLAPTDGRTLVRFDHTGWRDDDEEMVRIVTFGWGLILPRLKQHAETGDRVPFFDF